MAPSVESFTSPIPDKLIYGQFPVRTKSVVVGASQTLTRGAIIGQKNTRKTVTIDATGGTYKLVVNGEETGNIAFDAVAATIQSAIEALANVKAGDVAVSGSGPFAIQFKGRLAGATVTLTSVATGLTGGASTATVADGGSGTNGQFIQSAPTASDGSEDPVAILAEDVTTGAAETKTAVAYVGGHFNSRGMSYGDHKQDTANSQLRDRGIYVDASSAA